MASLKRKFEQLGEEQANLGFDPLGNDRPILANILVSQIEPDPDQPRKDVGNLDELMASIREHGILQPIIVSIVGDDQYRLIAGERRFTAARALKLETVPALVRTIEEHRRLEVQLVENIHRKDLSAVEEAGAYRRLINEFKLSQRQLAQRLRESPPPINQNIPVLRLPVGILESAQTSERLTRSVLLEIAKLETEEEQLRLWRAALSNGLTVKDARASKSGTDRPSTPRTKFPFRTESALVTVVFEKEEASPEEVQAALKDALKAAQRWGRTTVSDLADQGGAIPRSDGGPSRPARR